MKKNKNMLYLLIMLCCLFAISGCARTDGGEETNASQFSQNDFVMDTVLSETIYGSEDVTEEIRTLLSELETEKLSWRVENSEAALVNEQCGKGETVSMEEDFAAWVKASLNLAQKSGGSFDPTVGKLTRLWNIEGENPQVPSQEKLNKVLKKIGYQYINIEEKGQDTSITMKKGSTLDLGAVGKGIGCDLVREYLKGKDSVQGAVIAVGGSILVYGAKPDGEDWTVAIRDPKGEDGTYMGVISLSKTACVSTSGDYEKYFVQDGKKYHHILNPATGYPADSGLTSVTVLCDNDESMDGLLSDGLSTACFILGKDKGMELLEEYKAEGVFIDKEQRVSVTDGLKERFRLIEDDYKLE